MTRRTLKEKLDDGFNGASLAEIGKILGLPEIRQAYPCKKSTTLLSITRQGVTETLRIEPKYTQARTEYGDVVGGPSRETLQYLAARNLPAPDLRGVAKQIPAFRVKGDFVLAVYQDKNDGKGEQILFSRYFRPGTISGFSVYGGKISSNDGLVLGAREMKALFTIAP